MVRNFYVKTRSDGMKATVSTGPREKDGGFYSHVYVRDNGEPRVAVVIEGRAEDEGKLVITVFAGSAVPIVLEYKR